MSQQDIHSRFPFRPHPEDLNALAQDVSEMPAIQERLRDKHKELQVNDRVAHQYQIAGGRVTLKVAEDLPEELLGVGLFEPGATHTGVGRISTGLGTPHVETNPDFLGLMLAFRTKSGQRVDFLAINDPTSPTDNHREFMDVLHATGEAAGAHVPFLELLGLHNLADLLAEQGKFVHALKDRMGLEKAGRTVAHLLAQTQRAALSSTAYQIYWTGINEVSGKAAKFVFIPSRDENGLPGINPGERHLSEEWKKRQSESDVEFKLFRIPFVSEEETPLGKLTHAWKETNKRHIGTVTFPRTDMDSEEAKLWAMLASEMGANPGNWVHNRENSVGEPATEFGAARKLAYNLSQHGRRALDPKTYESVFETGKLTPDLAAELKRRHEEKERAGHVSQAPAIRPD
ncbi:MAG TPA: hypothetical protein VK363_05670 [Pyrinomonadaceae bacterium]|nr:hypothetical protein [Pyrinomonadaceae bacterium]